MTQQRDGSADRAGSPRQRHGSRARHLGAPDNDVVALVRAAASGDEAAWGILVRRYQELIMAAAARVGLNVADIADVTQTTWLQLFRNVGSLRTPEQLGSWLTTTARCEAIRVSRKSSREVPTEYEMFDVAPPVMTGVDSAILGEEQTQSLKAAMGALPRRSQLLLQLLVTSKESRYDQVAQVLSIPIGSLGPLRARSLELLRRTPQIAALAADFGA